MTIINKKKKSNKYKVYIGTSRIREFYLPFVKKKDAVVVNQCPCTIAVWLYASFLEKGMAAFMRRNGSPKGSPHFLSAGKFIVRHAVPHD